MNTSANNGHDPELSSTPSPSAPPLSPPTYTFLQSGSTPDDVTNNATQIRHSVTDSYEDDVALALAMSMQEQGMNEASPPMQMPPMPDTIQGSMWQNTRNSVARAVDADADIAMRMQQEERDAQIARELEASERQRLEESRQQSHILVVSNEHDAYADVTQQNGRCRQYCNGSIMCTILVGGALLVLFYGSSIWEGVGGDPYDLPPFFQDTWNDNIGNGTSVGSFSRWRNSGGGLHLTLVNSLTSDWYDYFDTAVRDWNACPALHLAVSTIAPDPECSAMNGKMKVCNAEYGLTSWTGLNEVYFEGNGAYIVSSVAKMNESYLKRSSIGERQYVMCHEIGHGFGLPHRDENTNNPDLGTCLDYTRRPENNSKPDEQDFSNLIEIYGQRRSRAMSLVERHKEEMKEEETSLQFQKTISNKRSYKEGRLLHRSERREVYESNLDGDIKLITTVLLAT